MMINDYYFHLRFRGGEAELVVEQISVIDEALRNLPDGDLKSAITKSREAYVDARALWGDMFSMGYVSLFVEHDRPLYSKYDVDPKYLETLNTIKYAKTTDMNMGIILHPVWAAGKAALAKAEQLAGGPAQ
jgi:hypothetical protein